MNDYRKVKIEEGQDQMAYRFRVRQLRRRINMAEQKLKITAPICADVHRWDEIIEPLGEQEFEEEMKVEWFKKED